MKPQFEDIDKLIKHALSEEEAAFYQSLDEQNLTEMVAGLFKGKLRWLHVLMSVLMVLLFAFAVYCAVQFFATNDIRAMLIWGSGAFVFLFATSFLKLFHWMQMDKNALLRELKRLELQVLALQRRPAR